MLLAHSECKDVFNSSSGYAGEMQMRKMFVLLTLLLAMVSVRAAVNINSASAQQLQSLPHIGAVKAQAIVEYRNAHGPFASTADIMKVKGIGKATYEKLRYEISVSGSSAQPAEFSSASVQRRARPATAGK